MTRLEASLRAAEAAAADAGRKLAVGEGAGRMMERAAQLEEDRNALQREAANLRTRVRGGK